VAVPRILDLLRRQGIPATFFVPGVVIDMYPEGARRSSPPDTKSTPPYACRRRACRENVRRTA
jgi:hypothetical protein